MIKYLALWLAAIAFWPSLAAQPSDPSWAQLDAYIESARKQWDVPGLAIAIVREGKVLWSKGYGTKSLDKGEPVDSLTIFANASTTKAMTAAAMAMLVDEGKVDWSDRVIDHLPEFQLHDPYATRELRVKDLFTHNAGVGNADILWTVLDLPSEEILKRMRLVPPAYSFRGGYTYQNIMYLAAGELIARVSGQSWESFLRERIFQPLGMDYTFPTLAASQDYANRSTAHDYVDGRLQGIPDRDADKIGPAGSVWSCVSDMARWMNFLLDSARVGEQRLISAENYSMLFSPQIVIPKARFYPSARLTHPHWTTYALGWFQHDYQGRFVSFHTGSLRGTVAIHGLLPDEGLGVFIYANRDHAELRHALMYKVFDVLGPSDPQRDWSTEFWEMYAAFDREDKAREAERESQRVRSTQPDLSLEDIAGIYQNDYLGELLLYNNGVQPVASIGQVTFTLSHWQYNTYRARIHPWDGDFYVTVHLAADGEISLALFGETFEKIPEE